VKETKEHIKNFKFKSDKLLKIRKHFYKYAVPHINLEEEIIKEINFFKNIKILDVGCGNGDLLGEIKKKYSDCELYGIDFAEGIIQNAKNLYPEINFLVDDVENLSFADNEFDIIIAKHVFHLVEDIPKGIKETHRCLKPKGKFIGIFHGKDNKPILREIDEVINKKFGVNIKHTDKNLLFEEVPKFFGDFTILKEKKLESKFELDEAKSFVDYFASLKWSWVPKINEEQWQEVLKMVKKLVKQIIEKKGKFVEKNSNGLIVAQKI
jgi:ubiquinone/menaquinone biosynthesis C-methylase UbiE